MIRLIIPLCMLAVLLAGPVTAKTKTPEVWMLHPDPLPLIEKDADWDYVRKNIDTIGVFIDWVNTCPSDKLKEFTGILKKNRIKLLVECGGTLEFSGLDEKSGERSAEMELAKLAKLDAAGYSPDYLNLDGSVRRLMFPDPMYITDGKKPFDSVDKAVDQLIIYMKLVKKKYPGIKFFILTNLPNWGWKGHPSYWGTGATGPMNWGDYHEVNEITLNKLKEACIPAYGVTVDNPYEYAVGINPSPALPDPGKYDLMGRIRELEDITRSKGLKFQLIINSEQGGMTSDKAFYENTLKYLDAYRAAGGKPDIYIVESWYKYPIAVTPETKPYSMTALVKKIIEKVKH